MDEKVASEELFQVDEEVILQTGPFKARWVVQEIKPQGIVLGYVQDSVWFSGYPRTISAPDGTELTMNRNQAFVGRAHLGQIIRAEDL